MRTARYKKTDQREMLTVWPNPGNQTIRESAWSNNGAAQKYVLLFAVEVPGQWIVWFDEIPLLGGVAVTRQAAFAQLFELAGIANFKTDSIIRLDRQNSAGQSRYLAPVPDPSTRESSSVRPHLILYVSDGED